MDIRELSRDELEAGLNLARDVFQQFEAPDYSPAGVQAFYSSLHDPDYVKLLRVYGAFDLEKLVGILATRESGNHVALFFVKNNYHRQGIGKALFCHICKDCPSDRLTVNSSPYAVEVYRHLGFVDMDSERITDGIRYTPMVYNLKK